MRLHRIPLLVLLLALGSAEAASAQATAMPTFLAPVRGFGAWEAGVTVSRPGGERTAIEGRYLARLERTDVGVRGGYLDDQWAIGAEARVPVIGRTSTFPLDGALVFGVGRVFFEGGGGQTLVPVGLTLGRRIFLDGPAFHVTPYAAPTVIFARSTLVTVGLGFDVHIRGAPGARVAWGFGDVDGFSIGAFWPR